MSFPDWPNQVFPDEFLLDKTTTTHRLVLWIPVEDEQGGRSPSWDRVSTAAGSEAVDEQKEAIGWVRAASIRVRHRNTDGAGGSFGQLLGRVRALVSPTDDKTLLLPDGRPVQPVGQRRKDLILVWAEAAVEEPPIEARIRSKWPESTGLAQLGPNLFLVRVSSKKNRTTEHIALSRLISSPLAVRVPRLRGCLRTRKE